MSRHNRHFGKNTRSAVTSDQMLPDNKTGGNKVMINGNPYYWEKYMWARDYQARAGEYDNAPVCSDPENINWP